MTMIDSEKMYQGITNISLEVLEEAENALFQKKEAVWTKRIRNIAAAFLVIVGLLFALNATFPAFAEGLPVIGRFFQFVNDIFADPIVEGKTVQGTNISSYGAYVVDATAESGGCSLTVDQAYSDGKMVVCVFHAVFPRTGTGQVDSISPGDCQVTVDGETAELIDEVNLYRKADGSYAGAAICELPKAAASKTKLNMKVAMKGFFGSGTASQEYGADIPVLTDETFEVQFSIENSATNNLEFSCFAEDNGAKLLQVEATPIRTKLTVTKPYWGYTDGTGDWGVPALYLEDGTQLKYNARYSHLHGYAPAAKREQTADLYFDGKPKGAQKLIFRFYKDSDDNNRKVLAEFTVDLKNCTAAASKTYQEDTALNLDSPFDYRYLDSRYQDYNEKELVNGFWVNNLKYAAEEAYFQVRIETPGKYREIKAEILNQQGQVVASGISQYGTSKENENWFWDENSEFWEIYSENKGGKDAPHGYLLKLYSENYQPAWNETLIVRLSDHKSGERLLETEMKMRVKSH